MKLRSIHLRNIGPHRDLYVEFGDGLIGIFGPQGSGKSTLMRAAYAGFTNDFTRIWDTKEGVVFQLAEPHEVSEIVLEAEHSGNPFTITRRLAPSSKNKLVMPEFEKPITSETKIRAELASTLGASRDLLDNYVFVDQMQLVSLFSGTQTTRSELLSHLSGTRFIGNRHSLVNKQRDLDIRLLNLGTEDVDRLRRELGEYQEKLTKETAKSSSLAAKLLDEAKKTALRSSIASREEHDSLKKLIPEKTTDVEAKLQAAKQLTKERTAIETQIAAVELELEAARLTHEEAKQAKAVYDSELASYNAKLLRFNSKRDKTDQVAEIDKGLGGEPPAITIVTKVEQYDEQIEKVKAEAAPHTQLLQLLADTPDAANCPTCGQSLADAHEQKKIAEESLVPLRAKVKQLQADRAARKKEDDAVADFNRDQAELARERKKLVAEIDQLADALEPVPIKPLTVVVKELAKAVTDLTEKLSTTRKSLTDKVAAREKAIAAHQAAKKDLADSEEKLTVKVLTDIQYDFAKTQLENDVELGKSAAASAALIEEYTRVVTEKTTAIDQAEKVRDQSEQARVWTEILSRASQVLHRDCLPYKVHHLSLKGMEERVNGTLSDFEAPFRVRTGEDLGYMCRFFNTVETPDRRCSGGQQVVLALSYRWALNSQFAKQIGMLVLDEPTAYMDRQHLSLLETTLVRLGAAAKSRGYQVFVITHEESLRGVFDQVVDLERAIA